MKLYSLRMAVAAALALAAGAANAATFVAPADGSPNLTDVSGSTATDPILFATLVGNSTAAICDPAGGDPDVYTTETVLTPGVKVSNYGVVCKPRAAITGLNNTAIQAIRKYSGGSGSGIGNVATGALVNPDNTNNRQWTTLNSANCTSQGLQSPTGFISYNLYTGCTPDGGQITKAGVSDVEPALLGATATQIGQLTTSPAISTVFNPVISVPLFTALQGAQHLTTNGIDDPANMPNLSSAQIRGILKGSITSSAFLFANPATDTGAATSLPAAGGTTNIFICRRGNSSGTQTSFQVHYLRQGCGTAGIGLPNVAFTPATTNSCTAAGCGWDGTNFLTDRVFAGTGSVDVINCMNFHSTQGHYAIGILSTEFTPNDGAGAAYRHVKVDGVAPSLENVQMGAYDFFTEVAFNVPNSTAPNFANVSNDNTKVSAAILTAFKTPSLLQVALVTEGTSTGGTAWWGGSLAIPTTATSSPAPQGVNSVHALVQSNPVNSQTRAASLGGTLNNCNTPWIGTRTLVPQDSASF